MAEDQLLTDDLVFELDPLLHDSEARESEPMDASIEQRIHQIVLQSIAQVSVQYEILTQNGLSALQRDAEMFFGMLNDVIRRVNELGSSITPILDHTDEDGPATPSFRFSRLDDINRLLEALHGGLSGGQEAAASAVHTFCVDVAAWRIADTSLSTPSTSTPLSTSVSDPTPLYPLSTKLPEVVVPTTEVGNASLPSSPPRRAHTQCIIEAAIAPLAFYREANGTCDVKDFASWAATSTSYLDRADRFAKRFGSVQRAHFFRSKKAPFYHEFVLVLVSNETGDDSWLRFERAARSKLRGLLPQTDSLKPLTGGVRVRETVSFATTMDALVSNADELASVTMGDPKMYLHELCDHINSISGTKPLYQLFSANCRWFARRAILTLTRWGNSTVGVATTSFGTHVVKWRGVESSTARLSSKLKQERFGGKDIEGLKGTEVQSYNLARLAMKLAASGMYERALEAYRSSLIALEAIAISVAGAAGNRLVSGLSGTEPPTSYSFTRLVNAIPPGPFRSTLPKYLEAYGATLYYASFLHEAVDCMRQAVAISRELFSAGVEGASQSLALRLSDLSIYLTRSYIDDKEAFTISQEQTLIWGALYDTHPDEYRAQFASVLESHSSLYSMDDHGEVVEAITYLRQSVALTQQLHAQDPITWIRDLIARSALLSTYLLESGQPQDALEFVNQSIHLTRSDADSSLGPKLALRVNVLRALGRLDEALVDNRESIDSSRQWIATIPDGDPHKPRRTRFHTQGLLEFAELLQQMGLLDDALLITEEALVLRREVYVGRPLSPPFLITPQEHDEDLAFALERRAAVLEELGRSAEAQQTVKEIALLRNARERRSAGHHWGPQLGARV